MSRPLIERGSNQPTKALNARYSTLSTTKHSNHDLDTFLRLSALSRDQHAYKVTSLMGTINWLITIERALTMNYDEVNCRKHRGSVSTSNYQRQDFLIYWFLILYDPPRARRGNCVRCSLRCSV